VAPVVAEVGWSAKPGEAPPVAVLRNKAILALGLWGDPAVIGEARRRFTKFEHDRASLTPDQQETVLSIVAAYADAAVFDRLYKVARSAGNVDEVRRYYGALVTVHDPKLAALALRAVMGDALPPQAQMEKSRLVFDAAKTNPAISWSAFKSYEPEMLRFASASDLAVYLTGALFDVYGDSIPPSELLGWIRTHFPPDAAPYIKKGLSRARSAHTERARLVAELNAELSRTSRN
ncbi:MAG: ERAP1-like C-terminal domain-containing protein, partial [Vulcanimicrobiaceae bacterium]